MDVYGRISPPVSAMWWLSLSLVLIFGFVAHKGKSLLAGILAHAINNLFNL